ncbi:MAG: endonuclease/exonuclease/phosphatase family protein [Verrucomicrobiota bacterium]
MSRRRLVALAFVLLVALLPAGCVGPLSSKSPATFRIMTWNIHHAEGTDRRLDVERVARLILEQKPDIVCLQEVDRGVQRTQRRDLPAELAALTGMSCVFSNNFSYQGGEYGNAVLTRFRIREHRNLHYTMLQKAEQRGLLSVIVEPKRGQKLLVMNTHLGFRREDAERLLSIDQLEREWKKHPALPTLVCGDFNDVPGSRTYQGMTRWFEDTWIPAGAGDGFTIPVESPRKRIDYIFFTAGRGLKPMKAWVPQTLASDHLPVVAEFAWDK